MAKEDTAPRREDNRVPSKKERQDAIRQIMEEENIETQHEMVRALQQRGLQVTQGTVSRDIREMHLTKVLTPDGVYCYAMPHREIPWGRSTFQRMMGETVLSVDVAQNLVVIKTLSGSANMVAEALDSSSWLEIVGSLAGDNTIFLATHNTQEAELIQQRLKSFL